MWGRGRDLIVAGVIAMVVGALGYLIENQNHAACNSGLGELGQAFSGPLTRSCTGANLIWLAGIAAFFLGVLFLVAGLTLVNNHRRPGPAPGWYPDPHHPSQLRYWDGARWTPHIQRR